jgi:hypothetical protein
LRARSRALPSSAKGRGVFVVLIALAAWLAVVGCLAALCTVASRGDEAAAADRGESARAFATARRGEPLRLVHSGRALGGRTVRLR